MHECFHTTKTENLSSILKNGLQPIIGQNTMLTADSRRGHVSYSAGIQGLVNTFSVFQRFYNNIIEGNIDESNIKNTLSPEDYQKHLESIKKIQESSSYRDWIKDNIYLSFEGDSLEERNEEKIEDSYTTYPISPEQLKVCVIRSKKNEDLQLFSMVDIYAFLYAKHPELKTTLGMWRYEDEIKKFESDEYFLEHIDLSKFCEMHPDLFISKEETKGISTRELGEQTLKEISDTKYEDETEKILNDRQITIENSKESAQKF